MTRYTERTARAATRARVMERADKNYFRMGQTYGACYRCGIWLTDDMIENHIRGVQCKFVPIRGGGKSRVHHREYFEEFYPSNASGHKIEFDEGPTYVLRPHPKNYIDPGFIQMRGPPTPPLSPLLDGNPPAAQAPFSTNENIPALSSDQTSPTPPRSPTGAMDPLIEETLKDRARAELNVTLPNEGLASGSNLPPIHSQSKFDWLRRIWLLFILE